MTEQEKIRRLRVLAFRAETDAEAAFAHYAQIIDLIGIVRGDWAALEAARDKLAAAFYDLRARLGDKLPVERG